MPKQPEIAPAAGRLGVLTPGMGAVATTFIAGVLAARAGYAEPVGSVSQMSHIRLGKRTDDVNPRIKDFAPLADLADLEFGGWDPYSDDAYTSAMKAGVLDSRQIEGIGEELRAVKPYPAVFSHEWVKNLEEVDHVKGSWRTSTVLAPRKRWTASSWSGAGLPRLSRSRQPYTSISTLSRRGSIQTTRRSRRRSSTPMPP